MDIFDKIQFHKIVTKNSSPEIDSLFSALIPEFVVSDGEDEIVVIDQDESVVLAREHVFPSDRDDEDDQIVDESRALCSRRSSGTLSNLLCNIGLRKLKRSQLPAGVSKVIPITIGDNEEYSLVIPTVKEATRDKRYTLSLKERCLNEIRALSRIVLEKELTLTDIERHVAAALVGVKVPGENATLHQVVNNKCAIAVLCTWIRSLHRDFAAKVANTPSLITIEDGGLLHIRKTTKSGIPSWKCRPVLQPTREDIKPPLRSTSQLLKLIAFCFCSDGKSTTAKIDLLLSVHNEDATNILLNPLEILTNTIRYLQLTTEELFTLFFKTKSDGTPIDSAMCPCGKVNDILGPRIRPHPGDCEFKTFVHRKIPSIISDDGTYGPTDREALTLSETRYLTSVLKHRLPTFEWVTQPNDVKQYVRREVGQDPRVIESVPPSAGSSHYSSCSARRACGHCSTTRR